MIKESEADEAVPLIASDAIESYSSVEGNELDTGNPPDSDTGNPPDATADGNSPTPREITKSASDTMAGSLSDDKPKRRKRRGVKMTLLGALTVKLSIEKNMLMHDLAAQYFKFRHFWIFEVTQGFFTMVASILAFLATTDLLDERAKTILTTIVGSTTIVVGFLQALNGLCMYGTRSVQHQAVAMDLREIMNQLSLLMSKLEDELITNPKAANEEPIEDDGDDDDNERLGTFESVQDKFEQSLFGCKSSIPMRISEAFEVLIAMVLMSVTNDYVEFIGKTYPPKTPYQFHFSRLYHISATQIMDHPLYPIFLPKAKKTAEKSLELYRDELNKFRSFYTFDEDKNSV